MRMNNWFFRGLATSLLFLAVVLTACEPTTSGTDQDPKTQAQDTVVVVEHSVEQECVDLKPGQFCILGLDFISLGDSLTWNPNIKVDMPNVTMKDTVFEEVMAAESGQDTAAWFVKLINFPDGNRIYLESDFEAPHLLGRVRIETAAYRHSTGLGVGSSVSELRKAFPDAFVIPFPDFGVMELITAYSNRRMIFHIPIGDTYVPEKEEYSLNDLSQDSKVVRVVLM